MILEGHILRRGTFQAKPVNSQGAFRRDYPEQVHFPILRTLLAFLALLPSIARAGIALPDAINGTFSFSVCGLFGGTAPCLQLPQIQGNLFTLVLNAAVYVCGAVFLAGCLTLVFSGGKDNIVERGKGMLKASVIGYLIIGTSYVIYDLVAWMLY